MAKEWAGAFLSFFGLFLYGLYFSTTGFDVTDTGFNLFNQWAIIQGWPEYNWGLIWLADWIGGAWLYLSQPHGVFGAHLGWCFLLGINGIIVYRLLRLYQSLLASFVFAILIGIIMSPGRIKILYYTNLSATFLMAAALTLWLTLATPNKDKAYFFKVGLYGLLAAFAFHTRFPSLLALFFFPLVPILSQLVFTRKLSSSVLKTAFVCFLSSMIFSALLYLPVFLAGGWTEYIFNVKYTFGLAEGAPRQVEHNSLSLLNILWTHFTWKWQDSAIFSAILLIFLSALPAASKKGKIPFLATGIVFGLIQSYFFLIYLPLDENTFRDIIGTAIVLVSFAVCLILLLQSGSKPFKSNNAAIPLLLFLGAALISIAGSNVGILNFSEAAWLIFPALVFALLVDTKPFQIQPWSSGLVLSLVFAPMAIKAYQVRYRSPYRDYMDRDKMTYEFSHPKLKNIHSLPGRVKSFGEFLAEAEKWLEKDEYTLAYNSIPIMYFLTDTKPYLKNPWPTIHGGEAVQFFLTQTNTDPIPRIVMRAKTNTQSGHWGNGVFVQPHKQIYFDGTQALDAWVVKNKYKIVWQNQDFIIFQRPEN